jgi:hypothetical protein
MRQFDLHIALHGLHPSMLTRRPKISRKDLVNKGLVHESATCNLVCKLVCIARMSTLCMHANQIRYRITLGQKLARATR